MQSFNGLIAALILPALEVSGIKLIFFTIRDAPEVSSGPHRHVYNAACPDIHCAWIKLLVCILFGSDVWSTSAESGGHVGFGFPCHTKALGRAKVGEFETAIWVST